MATQLEIATKIVTYIIDNTLRKITPAQMREILNDLNDSLVHGAADIDHNDLSGLNVGDYQHLTAQQLADLTRLILNEGSLYFKYNTTDEAFNSKTDDIERSGKMYIKTDSSNYLEIWQQVLRIVSSSQVLNTLQLGNNTPSSSPIRETIRHRGTPSSPSYTQNGDIISIDRHKSTNDDCYIVQVEATENHDASKSGSKTIISTIKNGTNTAEERLQFTEDGKVVIYEQSPSVLSVISAPSITPTIRYSLVEVTAQSEALTINNPTGTFANGQNFLIRINDDSTSRALTFDTKFKAFGSDLPTDTIVGKTTLIGCTYNSNNDTFECLNSVQK